MMASSGTSWSATWSRPSGEGMRRMIALFNTWSRFESSPATTSAPLHHEIRSTTTKQGRTA
jgi:hypothetical protein